MNVTDILGRVQTDSWQPINLNQLPASPPVKPNLADTNLIYPGLRHVFSGPPESAKTLAAYAILIHNARNEGVGVLVDFEMGPYDARQRLVELGATPAEFSRILYVHPNEAATPESMLFLVGFEPSLVVIDASVGAFELQALDDNKRGDVQRLSSLFVDTFWNQQIATIMIDHVVKNAEQRGRFQIGSERKLGGTDVHIGFDTIRPVSRGTSGHYKLIVHKDRGGYHRRGHLADLKLESDPDTHTISWAFTDPEQTTSDAGYFRPTHLMEKVSVHLELQHEPITRNTVAGDLGGTKDYILKAISALVTEGFVTETAGANRSKFLESARPYREADASCNPETDTGSPVVREWFTSSSANQCVVSGSVVRPPYGDDTTRPHHPDHPEPDGWFGQNGHLADAYFDQIELPDEEL